MATTCDFCGYKSNEVKSGSGMSSTGVKLTLHITDPSDLSRDILKVCMHTSYVYNSLLFVKLEICIII